MSKKKGNEAVMRDAMNEIYNTLDKIRSFTPTLKDVSLLMRKFSHVVCHAKEVVDNIACSAPQRNCDKFRDVDEAYDQFMNYIKRENPSFTKASPLHTAWDALKWVLDSK